jgi:1-deoxy-D-xylulose-5-phosphate reductoisomerase
MDFARPLRLDFAPPDISRFPAIGLGLQVARLGGTAGAVFNAANEIAVNAFLEKRIGFNEIVRIVGDVLGGHPFQEDPTMEQILTADRWAREATRLETD